MAHRIRLSFSQGQLHFWMGPTIRGGPGATHLLDESDLDCVSGDLDAPVRKGGRSVREILTGRGVRDRAYTYRYHVSKAAAAEAGLVTMGDPILDLSLRSWLANGVLAFHDSSCTGEISYSRNYARYDRQNHPHLTYRNTVPTADHLVATGLFEHGIQAKRGDHLWGGPQSTLRPKAETVRAMMGHRLEVDPHFVSVRLRDDKKKGVLLPETDEVREIQAEMDGIINPFLQSFTVTMRTDAEHVRVEEVMPGVYRCPLDTTKPLRRQKIRRGQRPLSDEERQPRRPTHNLFVALDMRAHRVFNRNSMFCGGRLYGPWQHLWKESRALILLNGKPVKELDHKSLHARMLYGLENRNCPKDPYTPRCKRFGRDHGKIAFLIMVNATNEEEALAAIAWAFNLDANSAKGLYCDIAHINRGIKNRFASDAGISLMNEDAKICIRVLRECIERGIPCLPVHDSFIVPEDQVSVVDEIKDRVLKDWLKACRAPKTVKASKQVEVRDSLVLHMLPCAPLPSPACLPVPSALDEGVTASSLPEDDALPRYEDAAAVKILLYGAEWVERAREADDAEMRRRAFNMVGPWDIIPTLAELRRFRSWSALRASLTRSKVVTSPVPSARRRLSDPSSRAARVPAVMTSANLLVLPAATQACPEVDPVVAAAFRCFPGSSVVYVDVDREAA